MPHRYAGHPKTRDRRSGRRRNGKECQRRRAVGSQQVPTAAFGIEPAGSVGLEASHLSVGINPQPVMGAEPSAITVEADGRHGPLDRKGHGDADEALRLDSREFSRREKDGLHQAMVGLRGGLSGLPHYRFPHRRLERFCSAPFTRIRRISSQKFGAQFRTPIFGVPAPRGLRLGKFRRSAMVPEVCRRAP